MCGRTDGRTNSYKEGALRPKSDRSISREVDQRPLERDQNTNALELQGQPHGSSFGGRAVAGLHKSVRRGGGSWGRGACFGCGN